MTFQPADSKTKTLAKIVFYFIWRVVWFSSIGFGLNILLFINAAAPIWMICGLSHASAHISSPLGALIILIICYPSTILSALFIFAFPYAYFFMGQKAGLVRVCRYLTQNRLPSLDEILKKVLLFVLTQGESLNEKNLRPLMTLIDRAIAQTQGSTPAFRWLIGFLLRKIKLPELLATSRFFSDAKTLGRAATIEATLAQIHARIDLFTKKRAGFPWLLLATNLALFGCIRAAYYYYGSR